ncbi:uroporphyrinogen-III C-methyltransferase [Jeotgalibacillus proteolyticus]|uniref:Uroporphyrinogen-III C-methyltransferase n=1 Tax=Jeotgalibacillus proteolyticus TaxID=2082395 RepID=A0A2S5GD82_9BACL|nr:uroporphyrinogen-III C-methyltransferase [Jeotgalibacillus proteolyticus]PPA70997.1 uroporphyrinogen-III C-methyltransferase [Jeotgalibacillus proteolyticus]
MSKVHIVGAGPGDPDLITVKALKCIQQADVILYDRLVNRKLLEEAKSGVELVFCGKHPKLHIKTQDMINELLVEYALKGKRVTRLKGGDPFVFGRGAEEAEALASRGIPYEVVPGITSGIAAPAYADIPVTHRELGSSFAVITGHRCADNSRKINWRSVSENIDTLVIYMGISNLPYICDQLLTTTRLADTPVAIIEQGTTEHQRVVTATLTTIVKAAEQAEIKNPAMIVIGEVVGFRGRMQKLKTASLTEAVALRA